MYDICFSGIEKNSIVIVSTGCMNNQKVFLKGFNEMKKRIEPPDYCIWRYDISESWEEFRK